MSLFRLSKKKKAEGRNNTPIAKQPFCFFTKKTTVQTMFCVPRNLCPENTGCKRHILQR